MPVLPQDRWSVSPRVSHERAQQRVIAEICDGTFRPPDARESCTIETLHAVFVPFWRVDIARMDEAQRVEQERLGRLGVPQQGPTDATTGWMVCAVSTFPYELRHPASIIPGDARPLLLHVTLLEQGDPDPFYGWEALEADVDEATARALAAASFRKLALDPSVLLNEDQIVIRSIHFVRYPLWFARYRYRGQAAPTRDGLFHVGISAVDEACVTAIHPSKLLAGAAKLKKLFGLSR